MKCIMLVGFQGAGAWLHHITCHYSLFPHYSSHTKVCPSNIYMCLDVPLSSTSGKFNVPVHPMTLGEFYEQHIKVKKPRGKDGDEVLERTDHPLYTFEQVSETDVKK